MLASSSTDTSPGSDDSEAKGTELCDGMLAIAEQALSQSPRQPPIGPVARQCTSGVHWLVAAQHAQRPSRDGAERLATALIHVREQRMGQRPYCSQELRWVLRAPVQFTAPLTQHSQDRSTPPVWVDTELAGR